VKINFFILDRSPEPFDEDVVTPAALPIHAQLRGDFVERLDECAARELRALIGVEDLWATVLGQCRFKCSDAEVRREAGRDRPRENLVHCPIENREEISSISLVDEAVSSWFE